MARIEKLKFKDFKSFKKAVIPVANGFTAIIGPNGSGKSNILDGLCFALGASSMKELRASRLTDLVHNKSKDNIAEVVVEIRDDGGELVTISRTIDKKGVSVFRINNFRTTRFQVEELLRSMNIRADGHNIVMQGDVTKFIKMTPSQRRGLIDEVSGIAEYEEKKQEALRELSKVEEKLKEAGIVLSEREGYLRSLEKEKIEAEVYLKLKKELRELQATIVHKDLASAEKSFEKLLSKIVELKEQSVKIEDEKKKVQEEIAETDKETEELMKKIIEESNKRQAEAQREIEEVKAKLMLYDDKIKDLRIFLDELIEKQEKVKKEAKEVQKEIKEKEKNLKQLEAKEEELLKEIHEGQRELERLLRKSPAGLENVFRQLEELSNKINEVKEEVFSLEAETKGIDEALNLKKALLDSKKQELKNAVKYEDELKKRVDAAFKEKQEFEEKLKLQEQKIKFKEAEFEEKKKELNKVGKELSSVIKKHAKLNARLEAADAVSDLAETASRVVKAGLEGVLGTVKDLCSYPKEYALALETAAGKRLYYLVTETAEHAAKAVKWLRENNAGRAAFIPLDKIKKPALAEQARKYEGHPEAVGVAVDLVKFKKKLAPAFEFVFGDTLVVKSINSFKRIGVGNVRMVSLEGDLAEYSGLIIGGVKKTVAKSDLEALRKLESELEELETKKKALEDELVEIEKELKKLSSEKGELELRVREAGLVGEELSRKLKELKPPSEKEVKELEAEIKALERNKLAKEEKLTKLKSELEKLLQQRAELKQESGVDEVEEANKKLEETQNKVNELKEELMKVKALKESINSEIKRVLESKLKEVDESLEELENLKAKKEEELKALVKQKKEYEEVLEEKQKKAKELAFSMTGLYDEKKKLEEGKAKLLEKIGELNRKLERVREELMEKEIEKAKIEEKLRELKKEAGKFKEVRVLEISRKKAEEELEKVQKQLDNLGSVNLKAVELYSEQEKVVKEMKEKKKKLEEEKQAILNMIKEIDEKKIKVFMEAFTELNRNFDKFFKQLYPEQGSEAKLVLENPENPLEGGLLVKAKPGGKQLKSIDAMSGGEKALTAIAFIFAVQAYNPSPFYVLDEIDAPLDSENSERVASMIMKSSKKSQFIVITHNPIVARKADQIIGVHMGKDGSSIIELDLKKYSLGGG